MLAVGVWIDAKPGDPKHRLGKLRDRRITKRLEQRHLVSAWRQRRCRCSGCIQHIHYVFRRCFISALAKDAAAKQSHAEDAERGDRNSFSHIFRDVT
jgi:hypothetical protein